MTDSYREPFGGKYYGIWNVEGDGEPVALFPSCSDAEMELARRQFLPPDDDAHLTKYHRIFPCDIYGAWWNSYDPDPRADGPLNLKEIAMVHGDDL